MIRVLISTVLGALVLFIWGNVSWMVLPWRDDVMVPMPAESVVVESLQKLDADEIMYVAPLWPNMSDKAARDAYTERLAEGPIISLSYRRAGDDSITDNMIIGFLLNAGMALIASILLITAVRGHCNFLERWLFVGALGLFVGLGADAIAWNWMYMPTKFMLINVADHVIGALLMGFVLALLIRPKRAEPRGEPAELAE